MFLPGTYDTVPPHPCQHLVFHFHFRHPDRYVVISHCGFVFCISLVANKTEHLFMCLTAYAPSFWWKVWSCILPTGLFKLFLVSSENLHNPDTTPLSDMWLACIFFQSSILFTSSFTEQQFLLLIISKWSIFPFRYYASGIKSKNSLPCSRFWILSIVFPPKVLQFYI